MECRMGDDRRLADLNTLLNVARELGATTELIPLLQRVESATLQVLDCERATVFLFDPSSDELYSLVATGEETIRFSAKRGIAGQALQSGSVINVADAYADERFNPEIDKTTGFRTRNLLTFPMAGHDGATVGVLQALNKRGGPFDDSDEELATTLAGLAGVAIQRQILLDEYAQKQKLEGDLSLAREIQQRFLPKSDPKVDGYDIAGWNRPADETGGDCYDYVPLPDGRLGILLADATGHGIGPALIISQCRATIRALASLTGDIPSIIKPANHLVNQDVSSGRFVTTFFGALDPQRHILEYFSAGHGPLLHYERRSGSCRELAADSYPLGILPEMDVSLPPPIVLQPGDAFILITDGFFEWQDPDGEQFGIERLNSLIHENRDGSSIDLIRTMHSTVTTFSRGTPQTDDLTAVVIKRML